MVSAAGLSKIVEISHTNKKLDTNVKSSALNSQISNNTSSQASVSQSISEEGTPAGQKSTNIVVSYHKATIIDV